MKIKKLINNFSDSGKTLSQRVVRGGFWVFLLRITERAFSLIRLVILARILSPNDFGLMGIALLTMATLDTFSQTGFQQALIQKKKDIKSYLDSAWTVLILRGFILFAILYFIAPYTATFFNAPEAKPIIQAIGFAVLFQAFTNIGVIYFQKELEFNKQFIYQLSGTLADFVVAISAALILKSVWALVFGLLARNFVQMVISYFIHPHRPRPWLEWENARELYVFGRWILGSSALGFLAIQGDDIFVGKVLGVTALGLYQMAFRLSNLPATEITGVISQVTFPAYSKLQDNIPKLRVAFLKTFEVTSATALPLTAGILILSPELTRLFLGEKWMPMVPALQLLSLSGLILSLVAVGGPLFWGVGQPRIGFWMNIIRVGVMAAVIYPLTAIFGIIGAAVTVLLGICATIPIFVKTSLNITGVSFSDLWKRFYPSLTGTIVMSLLISFAMMVFSQTRMSVFFGIVVLGVFSYLGFCYGIWKIFGIGPVHTIHQVLSTKRSEI